LISPTRRSMDFPEVLEEIGIGGSTAVSFSKYMGWGAVNPVRQNKAKVVDSEKIVYDYFQKIPQIEKKVQKAEERKGSLKPYRTTFTEEIAQHEAARCLHCGRCTECDNCLIFCPDVSVLVQGNHHFGYAFDYDYCKGCGICFTECPRHSITMVEEETPVEIDN